MKTSQPGNRLISIKRVILLFISLNLLLLSCKANYNQENKIKEIAEKELGNDYSIAFNDNKAYVLCQQNRINDHANREIKYIVVNVSSKEIVNKGSFQSGYVKWLNNESIEVATSDKFSPDVLKTTIRIKSNEQ